MQDIEERIITARKGKDDCWCDADIRAVNYDISYEIRKQEVNYAVVAALESLVFSIENTEE